MIISLIVKCISFKDMNGNVDITATLSYLSLYLDEAETEMAIEIIIDINNKMRKS
jgi:hypothetical protein